MTDDINRLTISKPECTPSIFNVHGIIIILRLHLNERSHTYPNNQHDNSFHGSDITINSELLPIILI